MLSAKFMNLIRFFIVLAIVIFPFFKANAQEMPTATLKWQLDLDSWPYSPQAGDLNKDGSPEIVFSTDHFIYILSSGGKIIRKIPISFNENGNPPVLVNMDGDSDLEIVTANGNSVGAWNMDGSQVMGWPQRTNREYVNSVLAGDMEKDGKIDIVATAYDAVGFSQIYVWNNKGEKRPGWPKQFNFWPGVPALADLDHDKKLELIFPTKILGNQSLNTKLFVFRENGSLFPGWPIINSRDINVVSVGDLDNDGELEILAGTGYALDFGGNKILAFNRNGTKFGDWVGPETNYNLAEISLGDMNNDGKVEAAIDDAAGGGGYARILNYVGNPVNRNWPITISPELDALQTPILADITNDGKADFISPLTSGKIFAARVGGRVINLNIDISPLMALNILVNDFDKDGNLEILVLGTKDSVSKAYMYGLDSIINYSSMQWISNRHDLRNSGKYVKVAQPVSSGIQFFNDIEE